MAEQTKIGALLRADPLPATAAELRRWIAEHPDLAPSAAQHSAIDFLRQPPLSPPVRAGYRVLFNAAVTTIPEPIARQLGTTTGCRAAELGRLGTSGLRWALGASPSWRLALIRCGAPVPPGLFRDNRPAPAGVSH